MSFQSILKHRSVFFSYYYPLFTVYFLIHIGTMNFNYQYINNIFFESPSNLKESFFGIGLICYYNTSFFACVLPWPRVLGLNLCIASYGLMQMVLHQDQTVCNQMYMSIRLFHLSSNISQQPARNYMVFLQSIPPCPHSGILRHKYEP